MARLECGRILLAASDWPGTPLRRLHAGGALDATFNPTTQLGGDIRSLHILADGRILAAGPYFFLGEEELGPLVRLDAQGELDAVLYPKTWMFHPVNTLRFQPDLQMLVAGGSFGDGPESPIHRLHPDGTPDPSFICAATSGEAVSLIAAGDGSWFMAGHSLTPFDTSVLRIRGNPALALDTIRVDGGSGMILVARTLHGRAYRLERSVDLVNWRSVDQVEAAAYTLELSDPFSAGTPRAFYRVLQVNP